MSEGVKKDSRAGLRAYVSLASDTVGKNAKDLSSTANNDQQETPVLKASRARYAMIGTADKPHTRVFRSTDRVGVCNRQRARIATQEDRPDEDRADGQFDDACEAGIPLANESPPFFPSHVPTPDTLQSMRRPIGLNPPAPLETPANIGFANLLQNPTQNHSLFQLPPSFPPPIQNPLPFPPVAPYHQLAVPSIQHDIGYHTKRVVAEIPAALTPPHLLQGTQYRAVKRSYYREMKDNMKGLRVPSPTKNEERDPQDESGGGETSQAHRPQVRPKHVIIPPLPRAGAAHPRAGALHCLSQLATSSVPVNPKLPLVCDIDHVPPVFEDKEKTFGIGDCDVTPSDVLCGRGGFTNQHLGNVFWRGLVDHYRSDYLLARKQYKGDIAYGIVAAVRNSFGRFLKRDDKMDCWFEIGDERAKEKTSQQLREGLAQFRRDMYNASSTCSRKRPLGQVTHQCSFENCECVGCVAERLRQACHTS